MQTGMGDVQRHQELNKSFLFVFFWVFSPPCNIVSRQEETIPSMGSSMKEGEDLKVGEDTEQDQLEERLERGKRMKQQQICSWCVVILALQRQRKKPPRKVRMRRMCVHFMEKCKQIIKML